MDSTVAKKEEPVKLVMSTRTYDFMIDLVFKARGFMFDSFEEHFPNRSKDGKLDSPYPTVLMGNHVWEGDIPALAAVYKHITPKIKFAIPAREDILQKNFLQKEFRAKGILKLLFKLIDSMHLIPRFMGYIGCFPIKRPFRDNTRELVKSGELRNLVDQEWSTLAEKVSQGKNLFLFPEGTYNQDGYLNQIKKGVYFLRSKFKDLHFTSFTFTYDYLSSKKLELQIGYGSLFPISSEANTDEVAGIVREKLGSNYTVTVGNLASYILFKLEGKTKEKKERIFGLLKSVAEKVNTLHPEIYISKKLLGSGISLAYETFLKKASEAGFLKVEGEEIIFLEKLFHSHKDTHNLKKKNILLYHKNQLTYHFEKLDSIWSSIQAV
ncbi:1-acyl-sn-glycerol-3-phosphate acyltransferase [Leptospira perolatii]|uniref:1-acyl-sn-glycerol-3-phosphate acyltransferase n=1 Tax=Leptospira perolatii TaxID=2023191 RepID=A0A2M9ZPH6_9LEPT|nr:1-acyl-sn-glycerol-3-phosphate acyltransferase [Leptospira perolatii]PJZ70782.1 1-acyl-sn-glycerol-3-phosphate acyltransferase [Leptospira perolatii]PJZ73990.1 1-acyl-sn-glycerol-3-phosphate acyltransferase [Leptospira perolatii]